MDLKIDLESCIRKILFEINEKDSTQFRFTKKGLSGINRYLVIIGRQIAERANFIREHHEKLMITGFDVENAVSQILPENLAQPTIEEARKAIASCVSSKGSLAKRAGLVFFPTRLYPLFPSSVRKLALVYLAAVLEYLCYDLLSISKDRTLKEKRSRLTIRNVFHAIENDPDFRSLTRKLQIQFSGAGYVQHYPYPKVSKTNKRLVLIKKYQNNSDICFFQRTVFCRLIREIHYDIFPHEKIRFGKVAVRNLQLATEDYLVRVLTKANMVSLHSGKIVLQEKDIDFVLELETV